MSKEKRSEKDHRQRITKGELREVVKLVSYHLFRRLDTKGYGTWLSRHEILGILEEELYETKKAVHEGTIEDVRYELVDVAVGCLFAIACINSKTLDW